jgi:hypothetical protein
MIAYSFYHAQTGLFSDTKYWSTSEDPEHLRNQVPAGYVPIEGDYDHLSQQMDIATGEIVDYQPPQPSPSHEWNADAKRWQLSPSAQAALGRRRDALAGIGALEAKGIRAMRELALNVPGAVDRLKSIDDQIAALRADLSS